MRRRLTIVGAVAFVALAAAVPPPEAQAHRGGAVVVDDEVVDGTDDRVHRLTVASPALGREASVSVLLPDDGGSDADPDGGGTRPILWLLHGVGDDDRTWLAKTALEQLTAGLDLVVAMPEGGRGPAAGWYSDWVEGPAWETFHLEELLPLVEERFGAGGARDRRLLAGLSMGGFGAMSYAARHPDLWAAAASFSGAVHTTIAGPGGALVFDALQPQLGTPGEEVWGPYPEREVTWQGHDPFHLASNLRPLGDVRLRTGNGVPCPGDDPTAAPIEAGVYPMNLALHDRLGQLGIDHDWFDRGCGTHDWHHWEADLAATLPALLAVLDSPPPDPPTFDHRFVEDRRDVFGWRFEVTGRAQAAFTDLTAISSSGLTATGAGTLSVTTPPDHPGRWRVTTPAGTNDIDGDDHGRLRFEVALSSSPATVHLDPLPSAGSPAPPAPAVVAPEPAVPAGGAALPATGGSAPIGLAAILLAVAAVGSRSRGRDRTAR